jgi:hypothetical protein
MTGAGVERAPSPGGACWMCGLPAVCGEKLPGRRHKVRGLCQSHADAVFGSQDPPEASTASSATVETPLTPLRLSA